MTFSKLAIKNVSWASASQFGRQLVQYATTLILVGLLNPKDFGLMALALIVVGFLEIFKDLGTGVAIIQRPNPSKELLSSIFWVNIVAGFIVTLLIYLSADLVAAFFNNDNLKDVLRVLSISFFISSFGITSKSLLQKDHKFKLISTAELISTVIGATVAIIMALSGFGVWSIVFQSLISIIIGTTLILTFHTWKPSFIFNKSEIISISKFSLNQTGYNFSNYFARNLDYILIGKFLNDYYLGHYFLAYRIMLYPVQNISAVVSRVMFPIYSEIQNDNARFRSIYQKVSNTISLITFPSLIGLAAISGSFVSSFFGNQWNPDLLQILILILAPVGVLQSLTSTTGSVYQAKGRTDWLFRWGISTACLSAIAFIIGINWGVIGVAVSYLIVSSLWNYHCFAIPFKLISLKVLNYFKQFSSTLLISLSMALLIYLMQL
ncbi:MAG: MOP flippase family protein, partial [Ignavibacteria bacterium]|nr:MOP flippase family protein [Ignavibacteria bacterium]